MIDMALKFGTSGIRGLNTEFTKELVYDYIRAFLDYARTKSPVTKVALAGDLRESTPGIKYLVADSLKELDCETISIGSQPTPALALYCMTYNLPGIMITGSHIPADRNGMKFYWPWGEVLKSDELEISQRFNKYQQLRRADLSGKDQTESHETIAQKLYINRYLNAFKSIAPAFKGKTVVIYQHSAVGRDLWKPLLSELGFNVVEIGRSPVFTPVDTETDEAIRALKSQTDSLPKDFFAVVSTDGDSDRPFVCDENLSMVRGDVLALLAAKFLNAYQIVTPITSTTAVESSMVAQIVNRTKIGSPFVIEAMNDSLKTPESKERTVIGFEANGGLLLGSTATIGGQTLAALPTRDAVLPVLCLLALASECNLSVSQLVATLPARYTAAGVLRSFPVDLADTIYQSILEGKSFSEVFCSDNGNIIARDSLDGLRVTFENGNLLHFRPSGNAPEFRCYAEAEAPELAERLLSKGLSWLAAQQ
jgi:phosphomannomutase